MTDSPSDDDDDRVFKMAIAFTLEVQERIDRIFAEHPDVVKVVPLSDGNGGFKFLMLTAVDAGL